MRRDERIASMLGRARELAGRGHYPMMIEAVLAANGFAEAAEWIHQPHVFGELKDLANRARKQAVGLSTEQTDSKEGPSASSKRRRRLPRPVGLRLRRADALRARQ